MTYSGKIDWALSDTVYPADMNRIEVGISANSLNIDTINNIIGTTTLTTSSQVIKTAINEVHTKTFPRTPNSVNSAKVNASGYADFIAKVSDTSVVHYAGGSNPNVVETDVLGRTHTITADETITGMTNDGAYEMLKEYDLATGVALASAPVAVNTLGLTQVGTAISGGDWSGLPKENAFDNTPATWASSQSGAGVNGVSYIGKNFGSSAEIKRISLIQVISANFNVSSVKMQSSTNGSTWTDVQTFSLVTGENILIPTIPLTTQYVRFLANSATPLNQWQVTELQINPNTVKEVQVLDEATFYDGDYRTVTGVQPNRQYKKVGSDVVETTFIKRGQVTKTAGTIGTPVSYAFNRDWAYSRTTMPDYSRGVSKTVNTYYIAEDGYVYVIYDSVADGTIPSFKINGIEMYGLSFQPYSDSYMPCLYPIIKGSSYMSNTYVKRLVFYPIKGDNI